MSYFYNLAEKEVAVNPHTTRYTDSDGYEANCTDILKYERRHSDMSKKSRTQNGKADINNPEVESAFSKFLRKHPMMAFFTPIILPLLLQVMWILTTNFMQLPGKIDSLNSRIEALNAEIDTLSSKVDSLQGNVHDLGIGVAQLDARVDGADKRCDDLYKFLNYASGLTPTNITIGAVNTGITSSTEHSYLAPKYLSAPTWSSTDVLAIDSSGAELTAADLINKKLLLPYDNAGQEVYFYGQYNANNHWDGNCIINVYKDDSLILITDVLYNDGNVVEYRQVMPTVTQHGDHVWTISDRVNEGDCNAGDSWNYFREDNVFKSFSTDTVSVKDILSAEYFKNSLNTQMEAFYHGNTSDGLYNDITGSAYLIKYDTYGTIRTLYSGNFAEGKFNDDTGNAWYITRNDDSNTDYMYYKGVFRNGSPDRNFAHEFKGNLTISDIEYYVKGKQFGSEIKWAETDSMKNS